MKRFWLVMLSLGMVLAFSASALAVDVKFSGSYYAAGMYQDKMSFVKNDASKHSTAFYYQRLRVKTDFIVSPGLSLVTRFDALERAWGAPRTQFHEGSLGNGLSGNDPLSLGTTEENENIAFDLAYISYLSPIGMFMVGYQDDGAWGTVFGDTTSPLGKIQYVTRFGDVTVGAYIGKYKENSQTAKNNDYSPAEDADIDKYVAFVNYGFKDGSVGLLGAHYRVAQTKTGTEIWVDALGDYLQVPGFKQSIFSLQPYVKAKIGPVSIQAEVNYAFGDYVKWTSGSGIQTHVLGPVVTSPDIELDNWSAWIDATVDLGMFYGGASFAYVGGDDPKTKDKMEGGMLTGGKDWNPTLLLFNFDRYYWAGAIPGAGGTQNPNGEGYSLATDQGGMYNAWFYQGRVGVRPTADLDIVASVSYAEAVEKYASGGYSTLITGYGLGYLGTGYEAIATKEADYGWEVDVTATYKITNNLTYMLGVGYLFTGDYFKGNDAGAKVDDNFIVLNKLTLTF